MIRHRAITVATMGHAVGLGLGVVALVGGGGCDDLPPLAIKYAPTEGATQHCQSTSCAGIPVYCESVLSIRFVDPENPRRTLASICEKVDNARNLCDLNHVRMPPDLRLPARRIAVQVAVYPAEQVTTDRGDLECPTNLEFDANNFAVPGEHQPAIAGMGYYEPGDTETVVELGCADLALLDNASCRGDEKMQITSRIHDVETQAPVPRDVAQRLIVGAGEPVERAGNKGREHQLPFTAVQPLALETEQGIALWRGIDLTQPEGGLRETLCVVVLEDTSLTSSTVTCHQVTPGQTEFDLPAYYIDKRFLAGVRTALGVTDVPADGLVIGMVVDRHGRAKSGAAVRASFGQVDYLSEEGDHLAPASATTSNGGFISRDAPFNTSWSTAGASGGAYGGLIAGRVTVVVLQTDD